MKALWSSLTDSNKKPGLLGSDRLPWQKTLHSVAAIPAWDSRALRSATRRGRSEAHTWDPQTPPGGPSSVIDRAVRSLVVKSHNHSEMMFEFCMPGDAKCLMCIVYTLIFLIPLLRDDDQCLPFTDEGLEVWTGQLCCPSSHIL